MAATDTDKRARLIGLVHEMGPEFAERAPGYDRAAAFPFENFDTLRDRGFLGLCVPERYGGLGADFATYMHVNATIGRYCATTALTFNMHCQTVLWTGIVADDLDFDDGDRERHEERRSAVYRGIVEDGHIHSQPLSEGISPGATAGVTTTATPTDGGWLINGRKIFASLAGASNFYNVTCTVPGEEGIRFISVPTDSPGVSIVGTWDPLGMRGTVSPNLVFENTFVPDSAELLPPGGYEQLAGRWPYVYMTLTPAYMGLTWAIREFTRDYLCKPGPPGAPARRDLATKRLGWAELQVMVERSQALWERTIQEAHVDPTPDDLRRAWSATYTVMETAPAAAALAIRVCGGQSILRHLPLEQYYRDARCGSLMLPWSAEICLERLSAFGLSDE